MNSPGCGDGVWFRGAGGLIKGMGMMIPWIQLPSWFFLGGEETENSSSERKVFKNV